jgi:hypothetical protein
LLTATALTTAAFATIATPAAAVTAITAPAAPSATSATATRTASESTTPAATTTSASKLTGCALFTGTGNVHGQRTAFKLLTMEFIDGFLGLVATAHGHEGEAAGTAGELVEDDFNDTDGANLPEQGLEVLRSAGERKVSHVELRVI